jgi:hypothetical protein
MLPRWLSWMFIAMLMYMFYTMSQIGTPPTVVRSIIPAATPAQPSAELLAFTDMERWKRAINPDYAARMNCSVDLPASGKKKPVAFKIVEEEMGDGIPAQCGDTVRVQLTLWDSEGHARFAQEITLDLGRRTLAAGLDAGLVGLSPGGIRLLILPPAAQIRRADSDAPAAARDLLDGTAVRLATVKRLE